MLDVSTGRDAVEQAREALAVDGRDRPNCPDAKVFYRSLLTLVQAFGPAETYAFLASGFLRHSEERYWEHVASHMVDVPAVRFVMGTAVENRRHFCGEVPAHDVELSPFQIANCTVTKGLYALANPTRATNGHGHWTRPVVGVTWYEAALLALWLGCRLPTEAEWEFASGAGTEREWCCPEEKDLHLYAWYCRNANGEVHDVRTLEPNALGLYDMHGNVWEWCADTYDPHYYVKSERRDPLNCSSRFLEESGVTTHKVCRGGSMQSLSEMCRTRFRFHDPVDFWASDLGFRLARGRQSDVKELFAWLR
ncbi:MAG: formylglycine-generating enzyme family protein [Actinomycetota bacterium]